MTTDCLSVYVSVASREEAENIAMTVLVEELAACANILPGVMSLYRWEGHIEKGEECALVLKTTAARYAALQERIKQIHSYKCPCIVAWPIIEGNPDYLGWIKGEIGK